MSVTSDTAAPTLDGIRDRGTAVCIIGAGPAGLAAARALNALGLDYDHVERNDGVGGLWDIDAPDGPMYESAHFISSRQLSGFAGFPMSEDLPDYPSHRQILSYLSDFADRYRLTERITFGVGVESVSKDADGRWTVSFSDRTQSRYTAVICCSGAQWTPNVPTVPGNFTGEIRHAVSYRDPAELRGRRVLVVGAGNSGCDIACDAGRNAERAVISMRRGYWFIPKHIFGIPVDVFAESGPRLPMWVQQRVFGWILRLLNGDPRRVGLQKPANRLFETHPIINSALLHHLQHGDVIARPGIETTEGTTVTFSDGSTEEIDLILLSTGYRHTVPYAQQYFGDEQHPDLYLTSFSREHRNLFGIGFIETNSGAFPHFDVSAQMIANHLLDQRERPERATAFRQLAEHDRPDLSSGIRFDSSPRHQGYVDSHALAGYQQKIIRRMTWAAPADSAPPEPRHGSSAPTSTPAATRGGTA